MKVSIILFVFSLIAFSEGQLLLNAIHRVLHPQPEVTVVLPNAPAQLPYYPYGKSASDADQKDEGEKKEA